MGDLAWGRRGLFGFPLKALRGDATALGTSGSGKTETFQRVAYGARKVYRQQVIYLDAKGETKRDEEQGQDNAARFVATMNAAGAQTVSVFPALHYNGWLGSPAELRNRLLSVIDFSESAFYGDVAANALDLALGGPTTPRSSAHFLAHLRFDRLKAIYQNYPLQYQRVLALDKQLLQQVEMRYQVFFGAMAGQLDGMLDYANADAVYLRVRGFTLRAEAPRLGRFLVSDFIHYISERRRAGVQTLLIIDEFNALRMREETSILFERTRSFGGNLIISSQGYAGLGPQEYAERILDACSTYILHACSDPGPVSRRAGKRLLLDVSWSEDEEGIPRRHIRPRYDWRVPETAVIQQEEGQAFWIHRGHSQHVMTAQVPITTEQVQEGWREIHRQEEMQRQLLELEAQRRQAQQQQQATAAHQQAPSTAPSSATPRSRSSGGQSGAQKKHRSSQAATNKGQQQTASSTTHVSVPFAVSPPKPQPTIAPPNALPSPSLPTPDLDDDEPDRL